MLKQPLDELPINSFACIIINQQIYSTFSNYSLIVKQRRNNVLTSHPVQQIFEHLPAAASSSLRSSSVLHGDDITHAKSNKWSEKQEITGHVSYNYLITALCYLRHAQLRLGKLWLQCKKASQLQPCISNCWACKACWHAISRTIIRRHFIADSSRLILITSQFMCACVFTRGLARIRQSGVWLFNAEGHYANQYHYRRPQAQNWV